MNTPRDNIPCITTPRLILRAFTEEDADPLYRVWNDRDVTRYFPNPDPPARERMLKIINYQLAHWDEFGYGWWGVVLRNSQELIGWAGLQFLPETIETEVAYLFGKGYWGQGYATEAAMASVQFGFETLGLKSIIAVVHPENKASIHVIEKLGMSFIDRANYFGMDVYHYSLDRSSFKSDSAIIEAS
jgi:ribosomal-protein-alanine N-acetyltransferase